MIKKRNQTNAVSIARRAMLWLLCCVAFNGGCSWDVKIRDVSDSVVKTDTLTFDTPVIRADSIVEAFGAKMIQLSKFNLEGVWYGVSIDSIDQADAVLSIINADSFIPSKGLLYGVEKVIIRYKSK